jgi:hypothetical protein
MTADVVESNIVFAVHLEGFDQGTIGHSDMAVMLDFGGRRAERVGTDGMSNVHPAIVTNGGPHPR